MTDYPADLIARADRLADQTRRLVSEVVEAADAYERLGWEDAMVDDRDDHEGSEAEARFFDAMLEAGTALAVIRLKIADAASDLPVPEVVEQMFPDVPEYRRVHGQHHDNVQHWLRMGAQMAGGDQ